MLLFELGVFFTYSKALLCILCFCFSFYFHKQKKPARRRYETYGMYSDDDANSDASSACSERSYSSRNGSIPTYMRQAEDVAEVLNRCASANWSERKEGLMGLQALLKNQRALRYHTDTYTDPSRIVWSVFVAQL